jgi:aconitase B
MGIVDYNAKAKAAKTAMLQEGFKQAATLADNSKSMDAQLALMKAIAPDFAGDFKYNTIFDQYKNRTKKV